LSGLRRRGYSPQAIRDFCAHIGVSKTNSVIDIALLEHFIRKDLNQRAPRVFGIMSPLRVVITNYPEGQVEDLEAINNPEDETMGTRKVPFSRVIYIEQDDFREVPPPKYRRLTPGREVRLRYGYFITCVDVIKDPDTGEVVEIHCTYDPETRGGNAPDGRKVKATLHWLSAEHAMPIEVRLYDRLFKTSNPDDVEPGKDFKSNINPDSLEILEGSFVEQSMANASPGITYQFERQGYFCVDPSPAKDGKLVFNRTIALRDSWSKLDKSKRK
jgi:glutaminyl-tRNA synthetase